MEYIKRFQTVIEVEDRQIRAGDEAALVEYSCSLDSYARACDRRLRKYFPDREWNFKVAVQQIYE